MSDSFGSAIKVTIFGESHGMGVGAVIDGLAAGIEIDSEFMRAQMEKRRAFMQKNIADRTQKGDDRLFFLSGETLLGDDWHEFTVDGMHPNDLGFYRIAQALAKPIVALLRQNESKGEEK
ncbi:MAG: chorismate synthase, partial [Ruthenibacterium sp.]